MIQRLLAGRAGYFLGFVASYGLIALAIAIQIRYALEPCPLCISQRIVYMVLGAAFLAAYLHNPDMLGRRVYGGLHFIIAAVGMGIAGRHVWIQTHPDQVMAECGAGIGYVFERFPLSKALQLVFKGTGDCSVIDWTFLGLSIPQLSFIAFAMLGVYALALAFVKSK